MKPQRKDAVLYFGLLVSSASMLLVVLLIAAGELVEKWYASGMMEFVGMLFGPFIFLCMLATLLAVVVRLVSGPQRVRGRILLWLCCFLAGVPADLLPLWAANAVGTLGLASATLLASLWLWREVHPASGALAADDQESSPT